MIIHTIRNVIFYAAPSVIDKFIPTVLSSTKLRLLWQFNHQHNLME